MEELWQWLKNSLLKIISKHIPIKIIGRRHNLPYITREIKSLIRRRNRAFKRAKASKNEQDWTAYRILRKTIHQELRKAHIEHLNGLFSNDVNKKSFWSFIKSRKQDSFGVGILKADGKLATTSSQKAEMLNNQFKSVFTKEDCSNIPNMGPSPHPCMEDIVITKAGVLKLLQNINPNKAAGPDQLTARFLVNVAPEITPIVTQLFQQSIDSCTVPSDWKTANIAPIFKKGDRSKPENFRPISLTSILSKILEHIIVSQIMNHLEGNNILSDTQFGFRSKRSCESQLLLTTDDVMRSLNSRKQVDAAILDFEKAFDKVPHHRLSTKMQYYGIRGSILGWIESFLRDRSQRVVVDGSESGFTPVLSGVPQGTVLGPTLFLIYINDIVEHTTSNTRLFADDCLIYREISTEEDKNILQADLDALARWSDHWQMSFNIKKCHTMHISLGRKKEHQYTMRGQPLVTIEHHPYLGVELDNKMTFNTHIDRQTNKARQLLGFLRRNLHHCPPKLKESAYVSLVRPGLEYCAAVWDPFHVTKIKKIEAVQHQAARFVLNKPWKRSAEDSVSEMLKLLKWKTLQERRADQKVILMYKILNEIIYVPQNYIPLRSKANTRSQHSLKLKQIRCNIECYRNSFFPSIIPRWNKLSPDLAEAPSLEALKTSLCH